eukprot:scaffold56201_cov63-Phaeocystis_antarctica.AAC.4
MGVERKVRRPLQCWHCHSLDSGRAVPAVVPSKVAAPSKVARGRRRLSRLARAAPSSSGATRARAAASVAAAAPVAPNELRVAPAAPVLAFAAPLQVRVCALPPKLGRQQGEGEPLQAPLQAELAHRHCSDTLGRQPKSQP